MRRLAAAILAACAAAVMAGCDPPSVKITTPDISPVNETVGSGLVARRGDLVTIAYRITTPDGRELLSSDRFRFEVGGGGVIEGVDSAVRGMRVGGRRVVECPPNRHWGSDGYAGVIPPHTRLTMDLRLLAIE
jgi:FKBP-type peptidyl-prolyl cis-trans isomerase